jgi:hypothetical protein
MASYDPALIPPLLAGQSGSERSRVILRNAKIVNLTAAEAFEAMGRGTFDRLVVQVPSLNPEAVLREQLYIWWVALEQSGVRPRWNLSLARYLKSFRHHGYPDLAPHYQGSDPHWIHDMAIHNLVDECFNRYYDETKRQLSEIHAG